LEAKHSLLPKLANLHKVLKPGITSFESHQKLWSEAMNKEIRGMRNKGV
jgi:hypothetical protein